MLSPDLQHGYAELRKLAIFDGIPNGQLAAAIAAGTIQRRQLERDVFVLDPIALGQGVAAPVIFMASGQVAAAVFDEEELTARRAEQERTAALTDEEREEESLLKPPPLARLARKNLALFFDGELFNTGALGAAQGATVAFYTTSPAVVASIDQAAISELASRHPFFEARFRRALQASRERLSQVTGVKQEILDFFIRHGISVAGEIVRVRQLDRCIDCKQCEDACEERYGARRLTLGGYQLGMLDFVYTCRTCSDQRCIDPCAYDSIKYDAKKREVVINESTCVGCTACAQACPYGAIDMVEVADPAAPTFRAAFKDRLDKKGALASGAGTPRIAKPRRIANKCDHCGAYGDQACISACPTGALIEITPLDLFRERSPAAIALARAGYDQDVVGEHPEVLPTHPFTRGVAVRDGGEAKLKRGRLAPVVMWVVGLAAWLMCVAEILLRMYAPSMSLQYTMLRNDPEFVGLPVEVVLEKIGFHAGDPLAINTGLAGTALMLIAAIYPAFRRIKAFRWLASNTMWFDFHLMAGAVGPMFVILHSAFKPGDWELAEGVAFWSMAIVVVSGFVGRYLYTQVPGLSSGHELEELDHERTFAALKVKHPAALADVERELASHRAAADEVAGKKGVLRALLWLLAEDARRLGRRLSRRRRLAKAGLDRKTRRVVVRRTGRMMMLERRRVIAPKAQLLLHSWKKVHVPFTILLTVFSVVHIVLAWDQAW